MAKLDLSHTLSAVPGTTGIANIQVFRDVCARPELFGTQRREEEK